MPGAALPHIRVLLSTYQGAAHLEEQLESLAAQRGVTWSLLWRDDGSTDSTIPLLEAFAARHPGSVTQLPGVTRLGAGASFLRLLQEAGPAEFYAFMDQDDVWLPDKLTRAAGALATADIVCTRLQLVRPDLTPIGPSARPSREPGFATLLAHNIAAGCTMVLTPRARDWALAAPMPPQGLHDWWCALAVTGCGGRLHFDPEPSLLYRQHAGNVVGGGVSLVGRARRMLARGAQDFLSALARNRAALAHLPLTPAARAVLSSLEGLKHPSPLARLRALRASGLAHHAGPGDAILRLWVLLRRMP